MTEEPNCQEAAPRREAIELVTLVVGEEYASAMERGTQSKRTYCNRHGYSLYHGSDHLWPDLPVPWSKIPLLQSRFAKDKLLFFMDGDTIVMNFDVALESLVHEHLPSHKSLSLVRDCCDNLNFGVFLLRCNEVTWRLLDAMAQQQQFAEHPWWENMAFIHLYEHEHWVREATHVVEDWRHFNSFMPEVHGPDRGFRDDDFVLHFAGVHNLVLVKKYMELYDARRR